MSPEDFKDVEKAMEAPQEQFIETTEVEQVLDDDDVDRMQEDGDEDVSNADENGEQGEGQNEEYEEQLEIDMSNNSVTYFDQHGDSVFTVARHPSLPLVISGGGDNVAHLWTTHSTPPRHVSKIEHTESVISGGFTADGKYLVTADMNGQVLVHKGTKGGAKWIKVCEVQEVEEVVWLRVHEQQNGYFAFGGVDGSVWCYQIDETTDSLVHLMSGYQHAQDCTMGQFMDVGAEVLTLVTCSLDGTIVGWNCFTGQAQFKVTPTELKGLEVPWVTLAAAPSQMTKDTPIVACGSSNGTLAVINASKGTVLFLETVLELQEGQEELDLSIEAISWSAQRNLMVLGMVSGVVVLYDTLTWRKRHRFELPDSVTRLQFDRTQGDLLFASSIDGKVYIFNARTGEQVHVCVGHNMGVLDFTLFEEHRRLVTAGDEGVSLVFEYP